MKIIVLKTFLSALIPAGSAFGVAWAVYGDSDKWPSGPRLVGILAAVTVAGASGMWSYLSTSYAEHRAKTAPQQSLTANASQTTVQP